MTRCSECEQTFWNGCTSALPQPDDFIPQDVVQVLVDKCVHPDTGRPYTSGVLDRALRTVHFAVDPTRSAKQQAFDALPRLQCDFPIVRARMRFRISVRREHAPLLRALLQQQPHTLEAEEEGESTLTGAHHASTALNALTLPLRFQSRARQTLVATARLTPSRAKEGAVALDLRSSPLL